MWPGSEPNKSIQDLATELQGTKEKLRECRHSLDRAGADEDLSCVPSWYEGINLDVLVKQRKGSSWLSDPERIKKRQERAYEIRHVC